MENKQPYRQRDHLEYPKKTMFQLIEYRRDQIPEEPAYEFYGKIVSFRKFVIRIEKAAAAFHRFGIRKGDAVTICLPNIPQAVDSFYAINRIGAVSNMVHPLSSEEEILFSLKLSESRLIITPDLFYEKVKKAVDRVKEETGVSVTIVVCRMQSELLPHLALAYTMAKGKEFLKFPDEEPHVLWTDFLRGADSTKLPQIDFEQDRTSVILYSGGTSGTPKGICLTDLNFNALAYQCLEAIGVERMQGLKMLSCMPMFHGFGLGVNIHTVLVHGARCILMPTFTMDSYGKMLKKKKPNFLAGVPTIFEALLHLDALNGVDLSFLVGMFCGGDSLSIELKKKIDTFLKEHNAHIQVREGYGLTECVTASCLTPRDEYREGSIGIPFPDTEYAIVKPGTDDVLPFGEEGEIILTGPSVMNGYLKNPEETRDTLRTLSDGRIWLYTGDLGSMDKDGYVYFRQRIKRMIITNGYNVYPGQIENVIDSCPDVAYSCVIGVPDPKRMHRVRAYVVLKDGVEGTEDTKEMLLERMRQKVAAYALPREIYFRDSLPKTLVGKVAYRMLEEEAAKEIQNGGSTNG